jgi:2-C-methyl-D-erythritol 4-phosphate cytidylyltransferase/2-C-methyl-D-erythritol 2,4-cyclodiphosphate synthase
MKANVIIPAAGTGQRLRHGHGQKHGALPKQFMMIDGVPMVYHVLLKFAEVRSVNKIIVATKPEYFDHFSAARMEQLGLKNIVVVQGGRERVDSVHAALRKVDKDADLVLIHDAARPFVDLRDIERVIAVAKKKGAAILARTVVPTVKQIGKNAKILSTIDRSTLKLAETPQVFTREVIMRAHERYGRGEIQGAVTDDAYLVEQCGGEVWCVEALSPNIKITNQNDLDIVRKDEADMNIRIGTGFDTHRLVSGRALFLGGIKIPFNKGCLGHSDGDVLIHAIIDALLGAVGTKDIGEYFSDKNRKYKDISSLVLLKRTREIIKRKHFTIGNIDTTLICEKPHIQKHKPAMIEQLSECLQISKDKISIKGKTKEGMDSEGQGFSISAHAVALVFKEQN